MSHEPRVMNHEPSSMHQGPPRPNLGLPVRRVSSNIIVRRTFGKQNLIMLGTFKHTSISNHPWKSQLPPKKILADFSPSFLKCRDSSWFPGPSWAGWGPQPPGSARAVGLEADFGPSFLKCRETVSVNAHLSAKTTVPTLAIEVNRDFN